MDTTTVITDTTNTAFTVENLISEETFTLILRLIILLGVGFPVVFFIRRWVQNFFSKRYATHYGMLAGKVVFYVGVVILLISVLGQLGISLAPILGAAGILGVAIGFASQTSVSNIISGLFLIAEQPFKVAEVIELANGDTITASQFLEHFMFPGKMQYTPVEKLSGGEKRRLMLMMVLIKNPNFLVLDEPTNDLDLLTLNKLEEFLQNFGGCLLIVSHDRFFMDKLVDHYFVFEGDGVVKDFHGSYSEYREQILESMSSSSPQKEKPASQKKAQKPEPKKSDEPKKLNYNERREFNKLEKDIAKMEQQKAKLEQKMSAGDLGYEELNELSEEFEQLKETLEEKEMIWLEMAERA